MNRTVLLGALALACASPAGAQTASTLPVKSNSGVVVPLAVQCDAAGACHYRDVLEGLTPAGAPDPLRTDGQGRITVFVQPHSVTQGGAWSTGITNFPNGFDLLLNGSENGPSNPVYVAQTGADGSVQQTTGTDNEQQASGVLAANASLPLTTDFGDVRTPFTAFNVTAFAPADTSLVVSYSTDGVTFAPVDKPIVAAGVPYAKVYPVFARYMRAALNNGTAAQTSPSSLATSTSIGK